MHDRLYRAIEPKRRRFLEEEVAKVVPGRPSTSS
jgi:hypothetical protein